MESVKPITVFVLSNDIIIAGRIKAYEDEIVLLTDAFQVYHTGDNIVNIINHDISPPVISEFIENKFPINAYRSEFFKRGVCINSSLVCYSTDTNWNLSQHDTK